ncbi:MAG TPA: alpha/beta hydrolase [Myxococcales bacterium]|nr:alpha/beta hydrolase [Myxococcales bacterium]HAN32228.1 alpha/beta hydrolase [Myxococcales bacterium]
MLHGNPTWSFYYRDLVLALRSQYRCIVPDHIGCGLSDKPSSADYPYTLSRRADDLQELIEHLGIEGPLTLVVHDWGGGIGFTWACRRPEMVERFVIFNTAAFHLPKSKRFPWPLALTRTRLGAALVRRFNAFSAVAARVAFKKPVSADVRHGYMAPYDSPANRIATLRFVQDIPLSPRDSGYELIGQAAESLSAHRGKPALICWGLLDFVFDRHFLAEWCQHWPDAEVHRFDDCGHYIVEDARETIGPLVVDFLARTSAEAP